MLMLRSTHKKKLEEAIDQLFTKESARLGLLANELNACKYELSKETYRTRDLRAVLQGKVDLAHRLAAIFAGRRKNILSRAELNQIREILSALADKTEYPPVADMSVGTRAEPQP